MVKELELIVTTAQKGERLDHFLSRQTELGLSRSQIHKLIDDGFIEVNKESPKASYRIKPDDRISINIPLPKPLELTPENIPLDIVYEDNDLVVINKPKGLAVHPGAGRTTGTLVNALLSHCQDLSGIGGVLRPGIVHRLDKDTSGLLVVAKNDLAHQALAKQFKNRKIFKQYLALIHGEVKQAGGTIESKIGRHPLHRKKMAVIKEAGNGGRVTRGREAITIYKVLERYKNYTLVEVTLKTGRMHQIRVHMTSIGHPVVGDPTYGHRQEEFAVSGQLLHAARLGFVHPRTGKYLEFFTDVPSEMKTIIGKLRKK
ncbi:MAG: RluA family pseudouridine synthase [Candidatus Margulisbacteria bacterium]|nr:RluA family pseudouridine synthase [Candidatus Margulisiibacteriota bacterium]